MENDYSSYSINNILNKSSSLPIYNTRNKKGRGRLPSCFFRDSNNEDSRYIYSPENMKIIMMEDKLKKLEKENNQQVDKLNTLISYQLNNRQNKLNETFIPQPNFLVLPNNSFLQPLNYAKKLDNYYSDIEKRKNVRKLFLMKIKNQEKDNKIKIYRKEINSLRDILNLEMHKKNMYNKLYLPIKEDISNLKNTINNNIKKRIKENNEMNNTINEIQNNYIEIKDVLLKKLDKLEFRQKTDFYNLKNEFINKIRNSQEKENYLKNKLNGQLLEEINTKRQLEEMKRRRELDELKRKQDIEDMENNKLMERIKFNKIKNSILLSRRQIIPRIIRHYPSPFYQMQIPVW